jgi:spermidine synthase
MTSNPGPEATMAQGDAEAGRLLTPLFALTLFLSAFLLFDVQMIISKHILPWFGGSATVWTTCMLVFQLLLLGGYVYSHLLTSRLGPRLQTNVHLALLAACFLLIAWMSFRWPSAITPGPQWKSGGGDPVFRVALLLLVSVGLPFFTLATSAPLLQRWYSQLGSGERTYRLYSVSNLGSLLGLLSFPFAIEPLLRMRTQGRLWSAAFCLFLGACACCALKLRGARVEHTPAENTAEGDAGAAPGWWMYALWFTLPAAASAALLATTNLLCQEVVVIPLLWVAPLSLYLLSFIVCFDSPRWYMRAVFHPLLAASLLLAVIALVAKRHDFQLTALLALLFFVCMVSHGEVARLKPSVRRLTAFYLAISAGGAAGGIFVAIIAPRAFTFFTEFQLSIGACLALALIALLHDGGSWIYSRAWWLPAAIAAGLGLAGLAADRLGPFPYHELLQSLHYYWVVGGIGIVTTVGAVAVHQRSGTRGRGFQFVQLVVLAFAVIAVAGLYQTTTTYPTLLLSSRNFFGAIRVYRDDATTILMDGHTIHGSQLRGPSFERTPTTYFSPESAIGLLLRRHPKRMQGEYMRIGVLGLGAGTLAAYGRPHDTLRIYEINPDMIKLSTGARPIFTYVEQSKADVDIETGDGRLLLEKESDEGHLQQFDVLVLDAFAGDAPPVHLLTREAFEIYLRHMSPSGVIAVNISTRHIDLEPAVRGVAERLHLARVTAYTDPIPPAFASRWVLLARDPKVLEIPGLAEIAENSGTHAPVYWTDDYSNIFSLIHR